LSAPRDRASRPAGNWRPDREPRPDPADRRSCHDRIGTHARSAGWAGAPASAGRTHARQCREDAAPGLRCSTPGPLIRGLLGRIRPGPQRSSDRGQGRCAQLGRAAPGRAQAGRSRAAPEARAGRKARQWRDLGRVYPLQGVAASKIPGPDRTGPGRAGLGRSAPQPGQDEDVTDESTCTPGPVPPSREAAAIHLGLPSPAGSSGLPAGIGRATLNRLRRPPPCGDSPLGLAPGGVYRAIPVTRDAGGLLPRRFTLTAPSARRSVFCGTFPRVTPGCR